MKVILTLSTLNCVDYVLSYGIDPFHIVHTQTN